MVRTWWGVRHLRWLWLSLLLGLHLHRMRRLGLGLVASQRDIDCLDAVLGGEA